MLKIRCRMCGNEVHGSGTCGCPNMASIRNDKITAADLSQVVMIESNQNKTSNSYHLTSSDLLWQEERRQRKVKRLDFEIR
jgi:hypothetical protein